ncbi:MAG: hypothetical protein KDA42_15120, partial [Planctomycetales bacterium]|nr:hypothetical protein [Planctomycetales bacterium]
MTIALFTLLGILGGFAYWKISPPIYRSTANVLVVPRKPYNLSDADTRYAYELDDLSMHDAMIKSPMFVKQTIRQAKLDDLPSLWLTQDTTAEVVANLSVKRERDESRRSPNSVIGIAYQGTNSEDCRIILDAVVASYCEFIQEKGNGSDALANVAAKAKQLREELDSKEAAYAVYRKSSQSEAGIAGSLIMLRERMSEMQRRRASIDIQRAEAQRRVESLKQKVALGVKSEDLLALGITLPETEQQDRAEVLRRHLMPLIIEENSLLEEFGEGHPDVIAIRKRIELAKNFLAASESQGNILASADRAMAAETPAE